METSECVEIPPYPIGAGPGCILWHDGERFHWTDPPTGEGQSLVWNGKEWVLANPAAAVVPAGGGRKKPTLSDPDQPM